MTRRRCSFHRPRFRTRLVVATLLGAPVAGWAGWLTIASAQPHTPSRNAPSHTIENDHPAAKTPSRSRRQSQVVVLLNDRVIQGSVQHDDDDLVVSNGPWYSVRVPRNDVDFVADRFVDAYEKKRGRLEDDDLKGHLELAHWCMHYDLDSLAGRQLVHLYRYAAGTPAVESLEEQLRRRATAKQQPPIRPASHRGHRKTAEKPGVSETIGEAIGPLSLSTENVREFTRFVQPLILNRCGQTTCHGSASQNTFQLIDAQGALRKAQTWRNMRAVLEQVDRERLEASPLLVKAVSLHGDEAAVSAVKPMKPIDHDTEQLRRLINWISNTVGDGSALLVADRQAKTAEQLTTDPPTGSLQDLYLYKPQPIQTRPTPAGPDTGGSDQPTASESPTSQDPFDPAAFNQQ